MTTATTTSTVATHSARTRTRAAGILFLAAFLAYGIGASLALGTSLPIGVALMLTNSVIVIGIGALLFPALAERSRPIAVGYLATRLFEATALGVGAASLLVVADLNPVLYQVGMTGLGIGSLFFCWLLLRAKLVPAFLALWGFAGYAVFAIGGMLELAGLTGVGPFFSIPGGLFELFFGVWLIVRGFARRAI